MNRTLTRKMKFEYLSQLINRDGGFKCFYCRKELHNISWIYEHLNDNPMHSYLENIVLSCQSCNIKKKNDFDMKILAIDKKKQNEQENLSCERKIETTTPTLSAEIDIANTNFEIVEKYLTEHIVTDGSLEFKDALDSCSMTCKRKTGFGGQVAVRRYLDMLVSSEGDFMIVKNDSNKRVIVKREQK